jgi:gas vesicle protein
MVIGVHVEGRRCVMDKFLLGLGVGMIGGVLFAPRSGSETRNMIADKAACGADYLKETASESVDYVKAKTSDLSSMASNWMDKGKDAMDSEMDEMQDAVQHI